MGLAAKRRGGNGPPRSKPSRGVKDKIKSRLPRRATPSGERRRFLDPSALAQGMTSRGIGARIQLAPLSRDEMERDLRHMEAYANACTAYAQQFFIYHNRQLVQSGHFGPAEDRAMPVRIDPEEEKRISLLRKRIAASEAQREVLETEYMSLRAHYVYESQRLRKSRQNADGQIKLLQDLVKSRGTVIALRRLRVAFARDIFAALEKRNQCLTENKNLGHSKSDGLDVLEVWNDIEDKLRDAEKSCRTVVIPDELQLKKGKKKKKHPEEEEDRVVPWDCRTMPGAPEGIPTLLSQMSSNPERAAAFSCGGMFGSKESSMSWMASSLPTSYEKMGAEHEEVLRLREEAQFLNDELGKERVDNKNLQLNIIKKRMRNDEMCAMMTLLRSETEAVLMRHNVLLETREAKSAAQELHTKAVEERVKRADAVADLVDEDRRDKPERAAPELTPPAHREEDENDGDDEGMVEEDEEEGEIHIDPPNEVVIKNGLDGLGDVGMN